MKLWLVLSIFGQVFGATPVQYDMERCLRIAGYLQPRLEANWKKYPVVYMDGKAITSKDVKFGCVRSGWRPARVSHS